MIELILKKREEKAEREVLDDSNGALISSLKGRISKILGIKSVLPLEEISGLEGIYNAIDALILSKREKEDELLFKDEMALSLQMLKGTKRKYIKDHIIPVAKKVSTRKWGNK